jgi:Ca2+-binding RTX toxin-like protein
VVHGLRGDDQLTDGGVPGDWGVDRLLGGPGTDSLDSGGGADVVAGGKGGDYLSIGRGGSARGGGGDDTLRYRRAGTGCVDLMGGRGVDALYLTAAWTERNGVIPVDLDDGHLAGCGTVGGTEELYLRPPGAKSEPTWRLWGTPGSDRVEVYDLGRVVGHLLGGDDWVRTGWGDDRLWGGSGTDIVDAGKGDDRCRGFETAFRCEDRGTHDR